MLGAGQCRLKLNLVGRVEQTSDWTQFATVSQAPMLADEPLSFQVGSAQSGLFLTVIEAHPEERCAQQ